VRPRNRNVRVDVEHCTPQYADYASRVGCGLHYQSDVPPEIHWIRDVDLGRRVLIQPDVTHVSDDANHLDRKGLPEIRLALRRLEERDLMADGIRLGPVPPGEGLVDEGHVRRRRHVPLIEGASPPDRDLHSAEVLGGHGSEEYGFVLTGP